MTPPSLRQDDLIESIAAALQYISYYHPADYIAHLALAGFGEVEFSDDVRLAVDLDFQAFAQVGGSIHT